MSKRKKARKKPGGTYKTVESSSKNKNARQRVKYPGLDTNYALKIRRDAIDYDYVDKLSEEEKQWLNNFTEEFIGGSFNKNKKQIHPDELKKDCYGRNNSRNRCVYSRAQARNNVKDVSNKKSDESEFIKMADNYEDFLIGYIDYKKEQENNEN